MDGVSQSWYHTCSHQLCPQELKVITNICLLNSCHWASSLNRQKSIKWSASSNRDPIYTISSNSKMVSPTGCAILHYTRTYNVLTRQMLLIRCTLAWLPLSLGISWSDTVRSYISCSVCAHILISTFQIKKRRLVNWRNSLRIALPSIQIPASSSRSQSHL